MRDRKGLTLIEVLITTAVLAVLLAVVFPAFQSSRDSSRSVLCGANLKQIWLATEVYEQDHRFFPQGFCCLPECTRSAPPQGFAGKPVYDRPGWWWFDFLGIEDRSAKGILWCPSRRPMTGPLRENVLWCNYAINYSIAKWASDSARGEFLGPPLTKIQILRPAETLLYSDSGYGLLSWKAAAGIPNPFDNNPTRDDSFYLPGLKLNQNRPIHPDQQTDALAGRHRRASVSLAYVDGHVGTEKAERFTVRTDEKGAPTPPYFWTGGR
ncbi:MAG TPA: prepilin-type N-terminal cleavage/methylation domain-containing protein [Anaerohalosphaeraceae bacterium]|nr:prepilin-type N-terminal cleavage/methylation domain-containing protein [Anaerohalosphaeraceae bacterium]HOL88895.1 prepilin-type N-terminal cleavage/methylation domain-containing protein [Anaerohalosphaeraceae bacterium]HPP55737.1 prepilin-type N-terminal cleavage/methylation domain-containing protein [Anaerohalosphaeraceae bacterium]